MAGVGPFAVPAAKRGCFVFGNDLNPESTQWMDVNRQNNNISTDTLRITTLDGKAFIRRVVGQVGAEPFQPLELNAKGEPKTKGDRDRDLSARIKKQKTAGKGDDRPAGISNELTEASKLNLLRPSSPYIKHFIMNLPASAVTFLGAFRGSYAGLSRADRAAVEMPIVHCHYFNKAPLAEDHSDEKAEKALMEVGLESLRAQQSLLLTPHLICVPLLARLALPRSHDRPR